MGNDQTLTVAELEAAWHAAEEAQSKLEIERDGLPRAMGQAIQAGDVARLTELAARRDALPDELANAKLTELKAKAAYWTAQAEDWTAQQQARGPRLAELQAQIQPLQQELSKLNSEGYSLGQRAANATQMARQARLAESDLLAEILNRAVGRAAPVVRARNVLTHVAS